MQYHCYEYIIYITDAVIILLLLILPFLNICQSINITNNTITTSRTINTNTIITNTTNNRQIILEDPKLDKLLLSRLNSNKKDLDDKESIDLICALCEIGKKHAEKSKDQEIVVILGNTGAGKSTLINYILGLEMEILTKKQHGISGISNDIIR